MYICLYTNCLYELVGGLSNRALLSVASTMGPCLPCLPLVCHVCLPETRRKRLPLRAERGIRCTGAMRCDREGEGPGVSVGGDSYSWLVYRKAHLKRALGNVYLSSILPALKEGVTRELKCLILFMGVPTNGPFVKDLLINPQVTCASLLRLQLREPRTAGDP